ncbi:MAG: molybdopterin-binding protein [Clostridiales bacterium]|nr:molybdopterin-binding protein [Clostridiales bacterium]MDY3746644.1 molybdopterin-binding protein [Lachnospiraceae bacterium]
MKKIPVGEAVGSVLCHDITQILPGEFKGRKFKKGHIIQEEDIPVLLSLGKDHIYVWENQPGMIHENDAALFLKDIAMGEGLTYGEIKEGKIGFNAAFDGILKVDAQRLLKLNMVGEISFATLMNNTPVKKGQNVAGTRVIPLVIDEKKLKTAREVLDGHKIISVLPLKPRKAGIVTTGNEVYYHRIEDKFGPIIRKKMEDYHCEVLGQTFVPDDKEKIQEAIRGWLKQGAEMVFCTGGMSVDPDDLTPSAIIGIGGEIVTYGTPVLPGAMFLLSYYKDENGREIPVMGLPGCVMHAKTTVFDLVLPRILAGEHITMEDIAAFGHGGLCMQCETCRYPVCHFGKGGF